MTHRFLTRHLGSSLAEQSHMLQTLGYQSMDDLVKAIVPESILDLRPLDLPPAMSEEAALEHLATIANKNTLKSSLIGQGYFGCHTPKVILRNLLQNPAWYTAYTPYQPEISQGRLELLFNFQTLCTELTGLPIANASLLDEATAAAEAMALAARSDRQKRRVMLVSARLYPQTLDVLKTRAEPLGIALRIVDDIEDAQIDDVFAAMVQYPDADGIYRGWGDFADRLHAENARLIMCADPLALCCLASPASQGADIAVGSMQRFGVPMFGGGPHAAYMAVTDALKRAIPGRLVGQSIDSEGNPAYRLALQVREQHIRREKATSNICTAQALLAMTAVAYAIYHGADGLRSIAQRIRKLSMDFANSLDAAGIELKQGDRFDTVRFRIADSASQKKSLQLAGYNLHDYGDDWLGASFDETHGEQDLERILTALNVALVGATTPVQLPHDDRFLSQACFSEYRSETEMMRYLRRLSDRDLALDRTMIPLGSCTMKLNSAAEMEPISWPEFSNIHPFAPAQQLEGYRQLVEELDAMLSECTGYHRTSIQPNAGSQGEYAGLLAIADYHRSRDEAHRNICLIPSSAHGTNPASAQLAGLQVVVVACDAKGNVDLADLQSKIETHKDNLAVIMVTYPSTHGVFEASITELCKMVHDAGGLVYVDGANLNALVGVAKPGQFGGDVSHLNLHKTFCIPHGGGGPGVGPVSVGEILVEFLPGHRELAQVQNVVSAAPYGSAGILPITWMYLRMMGPDGMRSATENALLNANYMAKRLSEGFEILYTGQNGMVAHECIVDLRPFKTQYGVSVDDVAKRLIDYGFHAPTMSFPVAGTLMIEPTESESLVEIDRFIDAMMAIRQEILDTDPNNGRYAYADSPLAHAPHTQRTLLGDWSRPYSRLEAAVLSESQDKYWPPVARVDNVFGDKNLVCSCPPMSDYQ